MIRGRWDTQARLLISYHGAVVANVDNTPANREHFQGKFRLELVSRDERGTEHWEAVGVKAHLPACNVGSVHVCTQ